MPLIQALRRRSSIKRGSGSCGQGSEFFDDKVIITWDYRGLFASSSPSAASPAAQAGIPGIPRSASSEADASGGSGGGSGGASSSVGGHSTAHMSIRNHAQDGIDVLRFAQLRLGMPAQAVDGPVACVGWSTGVQVLLEMAVLLQLIINFFTIK